MTKTQMAVALVLSEGLSRKAAAKRVGVSHQSVSAAMRHPTTRGRGRPPGTKTGETLGDQAIALIQKEGISKEEAARRVGIKPQTVHNTIRRRS